jgi:hypothetical protein
VTQPNATRMNSPVFLYLPKIPSAKLSKTWTLEGIMTTSEIPSQDPDMIGATSNAQALRGSVLDSDYGWVSSSGF